MFINRFIRFRVAKLLLFLFTTKDFLEIFVHTVFFLYFCDMKETFLKVTVLLFFFACAPTLLAQNLTVQSFRMDETDLTANTAGTIVMDQNGQKCALIKVETTQTGFSFDAGLLGVVQTEQKVGEIWIYVPEGVKRLTISHQQFGVLRDYDFGMMLKRARTYILVLDAKITQPPHQQQIQIPTVIKPTDHRPVSNPKNKSISVGNVKFTMVKVDGGTFMMGATPEQEEPDSDETPVHQVTLPPYYIGETEVTQELWQAVMGSNPSKFKGKNLPVENISWNDCQEFVRKLSRQTGLKFRLPTEAEWEYAARGGNKSLGYQYSGSNNIDDVACYVGNSSSSTHAVKTKQPNELGIYDMSGNVWEWCQDWHVSYSAEFQTNPTGSSVGLLRVERGGSWCDNAGNCRVANRDNGDSVSRDYGLGLRLVLQ